MKKIASLLALCLALMLPAFAQQQAKTFTISSTGSPCAQVNSTGLSSVGIIVSGTWSGTLTPDMLLSAAGGAPQATNGVTPTPSSGNLTPSRQATITANGGYTAAVGGFSTFQLCPTAWTSGTATVTVQASAGLNFAQLSTGVSGTFASNITVPSAGVTFTPSSGQLMIFQTPSNTAFEIASNGGVLTINQSGAVTLKSAGTGNAVTINGNGAGINLSDNIDGIDTISTQFGSGTTGPGVATGLYQGRLVAQTAALSTTTVATMSSAAALRIQASVYCDTSVASATATLTITYRDISNTTQTVTGTGATCTTLGSASLQTISIPLAIVNSGSTITWAIAIANSPHYDAAIFVEQITLE